MDEAVSHLSPVSVTSIEGAGNKFVNLVDDNKDVDFYLNLVPSYKAWDIVPSEMLLAARHGVMTTSKGA